MAYAILRKEDLNPQIFLMEIHAPAVTKKAEPGQFIILRIDEYGERVLSLSLILTVKKAV